MTPPRVAPLPQTVKYRAPKARVSPKMVVVALVALTFVVAALGFMGSGPLSARFVDLGLTSARTEMFAPDWTLVTDPSRSFSAEMPRGNEDVYSTVDPQAPATGLLVGVRVQGESGASIQAVFTNFGLDAAGLAAYDSPAGVRQLAEQFMALQMQGESTVVREAVAPQGRAIDAVVLSGTGSSRARFVLTRDRLYALVTAGPDSSSTELDEAHQRLLASFDPDS